jgi:hypothetical protein
MVERDPSRHIPLCLIFGSIISLLIEPVNNYYLIFLMHMLFFPFFFW